MPLVVLFCLLCLPLLIACGGATQAAAPRSSSSQGERQGQGHGQDQGDTERIAREARWAPGQLLAHFEKHGKEGRHATVEAYDASARETIRMGRPFTYVDRETRVRRRGFYEPQARRFTAITEDGRRITTHFGPDGGERYVRGLPESTY